MVPSGPKVARILALDVLLVSFVRLFMAIGIKIRFEFKQLFVLRCDWAPVQIRRSDFLRKRADRHYYIIKPEGRTNEWGGAPYQRLIKSNERQSLDGMRGESRVQQYARSQALGFSFCDHALWSFASTYFPMSICIRRDQVEVRGPGRACEAVALRVVV